MASSSRTRAVVISSSLLMAAPAFAQPTVPTAPTAPPAPPVTARPMSMQPGSQQQAGTPAAPRAQKRGAPAWNKGKRARVERSVPRGDGSPIATAPSFLRLDDGVTRVELEVSSRVDVAENKARGRVVYRLRGAQVGERTNQLPLLTGFFSTPVDRMQLVQQGTDVDLVIDLREASEPTLRVVETPRGIVLQVDFPRSTGFEKRSEQTQGSDPTSRERARRRTSAQTLGGSGSNGLPPDEESN